MTDTPGWASPGSAPSPDGREPGASGPAEPTDRPGPAEPAAQPGTDPQGPGPKWSKEQPPPGQWSAPTGPPSPGQAPPPPPPGPGGWGGGYGAGQPGGHGGGSYGGPPGGYGTPGYGAWGGGWGGPPPAAKPGVIPLRPLGVGEILDGAVSTMRTYWRTVLGISLTVSVLTQLSVILLQGLLLKDSATTSALNDRSATPSEILQAVGALMAGTGLVAVITVVGTIVATALLTTVTSRAVLGKPVSTGEAWRDARPQVPKLFGLLLLLGLISVGVLLCGALPGILVAVAGGNTAASIAVVVLGVLAAAVVAVWLTVRFSLASPALMLERQSIVKSMSRSAKLVRGSWWRVLGIQLLAGLIANIVSSLVVIPFTLVAAAVSGDGTVGLFSPDAPSPGWSFLIISGIGSVIGTMITLPINAGVIVLLYIDQRIRREALDLELARAAGVQDYGTGTPGPVPGS
ncbi:glycerophosphoryl diester phosphodiesterase membrane domain-containing protein [Streptomyces sp. NPDC016566]|uniref:glycerophosphoryl diester phosphodiesterase membrane domain-containing protein n=1 Tax=Streptomyces sp. NPDC016566 TaxID=3364967 RepID=UPI0037001EF9